MHLAPRPPLSDNARAIDHVDALDLRLATLGRGVGAMRLALGDGLLHLERVGGVHALGYPTLESYAREALGRSGRWAGDARALARRLTSLPHLRSAFVSGHLAVSKVELVARVASPDDEVSWVERAGQMSVRALRAALTEHGLAHDADADADATTPRTTSTISVTIDRIDAWAFERARLVVESLGASRGDGAIEAMLAEGLGTILGAHSDLDLPSGLVGEPIDPSHRAFARELAALRERAAAAAEDAIPTEALAEVPHDGHPITIDWGALDLLSCDAKLRDLASDLARRDLALGRLGARAIDRELWRALRFASFDHYCRERIGLSPSSIATRIALARRTLQLPAVEDALVAGHIGYEAAALVARIASPMTAPAWVARAAERTVKHLREEIDAVTIFARAEGRDAHHAGPPDDDVLDAYAALERSAHDVITGQMSVSPPDGDAPDIHGHGQRSGGARTTLHLHMTDETARFWRDLERVYVGLDAVAHADLESSFVAFLARAVAHAWTAASATTFAYADIHRRDRWRCASPVCRSRSVTPHHIVFRSRGGSDDASNVVSLCDTCHLELVHGASLHVSGDAQRTLTWSSAGWRAEGRAASARA